jgi:streptogramin lyase
MTRSYRNLFILAAAAVVVIPAGVQAQETPYREDGWAKLPDGRKWGATSAVDTDPDGRSVWVFERCGADTCAGSNVPPIVKLDSSGKYLKSFGAGLFIQPHGIHVDRDGNVWVTDSQGKDNKGHTVVKFNPDGKVPLTLGKPGVAGDGPDVFNQPSDVITAPNGDIFVADGHGGNSNARIVKFSKDGKFIKAWGKKGTAPGEFDTPHALAMDSQGRLFVGDRSNNRIQIFDQDGMVKSFIPGLGADPDGLIVGEGVAADAQGNVYWAETSNGMTIRKFIRK